MDTKWNSTDSAAEPVTGFIAGQAAEEERTYFGSPQKHPGRLRAAAGALAFFLGVSLVLGSLGAVLGRTAWQRGGGEWWAGDWQETEAFRAEVSAYLKEFLTLAAGGTLDWYAAEAVQGTAYDRSVTWDAAVSVGDPVPAYQDGDSDFLYRKDKNVLYRIRKQSGAYSPAEWYSNAGDADILRYESLPEGYNLLLVFEKGKVAITKDGRQLDVYGDGVYRGGGQWFVPGYDNFSAGEGVENAAVYMAVRETPIPYYTGEYASGGYSQSGRMYYIYESLQESRAFYIRQAALFGLGLFCLAVWFLLRREKRLADEKLASWTAHIWTEARFLAVGLSLTCLLLPRLDGTEGLWQDVWWELHYVGQYGYALSYAGRALAACLERTGALLCLFWSVWLIHNDHKYNPREKRKGLFRRLFRALRARELELPVQKRLARNAVLRPLALLVILLSAALFMYAFYYDRAFILLALAAESALIILPHILWSRRDRALARDIGLLAGQVEAIRGGDLSTPLDLPEDADLRQTAEALNDIQAGLNRALAEQTRSERMKVELVSNVSHDLKTPLTSILSYAELLRQEPLEGAAADYARIIDEKAQRLKGMVQDVFEVSKAAADQLPVNIERLDLAKLLRQTLADMDGPIRASRLTFKTDLPEEPVMIAADGRRLYRVFQNLIQNALQYALEGSRVYLSLKTGEGRAEASLRNTSRSELPEGVDFTARFVRGDESRTDGGSGLGLSIASSFTEACGGAFRVETVADLFTAVVTFPLAEE